MGTIAYHKSKSDFTNDVHANLFIDEMRRGAAAAGLGTSPNELESWRKNGEAILALIQDLDDSVEVAFEFFVPSGGRIDCMLFGKSKDGKENAVHIELKQWQNNSVSEVYDNGVFEDVAHVSAFTGHADRLVCHPSQQVENYQQHLQNFIEVFQDDAPAPIGLHGFAYCYNYHSSKTPAALYNANYKDLLDRYPLYSADEKAVLSGQLCKLLDGGGGKAVLNKILNSPRRQSRALIDAAANMFEGETEFTLLGAQITVSETIFAEVKAAAERNGKTVIVIKGGPGTGKTVIALKVLSQMARAGAVRNIFYTTRSTALKDNLKRKLKKIKVGTTTAEDMILPIFGIKPKYYKENEIELLLVDEAHRLMDTANHYSMPADSFTYLSQVMSLIYCSKVSVFFIDDHQAIDGQEIGYSEDIIQAAKSYRTELGNISDQMAAVTRKKKKLAKYNTDIELWEAEMAAGDFSNCDKYAKKKDAYEKLQKEIRFQTPVPLTTSLKDDIKIVTLELTSQFRCNGSDNYLDWLDQLMYEGVDKITSKFSDTEYEFKIFDDPHKLYDAVVSKNHPEMTPKEVSRLSAGYWWQWSDKAAPNGDLVKDVKIPVDNPTFEMPWETKATVSPAYRDKYAPDTNSWIDDPRGINQIGCVFTAQGFEVDYMGVILSPDIRYNAETGMLDGVIGATRGMKKQDKNQTDCSRHIRNIYRVLLSRGRKGTFIYCCDPKVREFFENCDKKRK